MSTNRGYVYGIKREKINYKDEDCIKELTNQIHKLIIESKKKYNKIILLCIGTDRSTGDSFAPLLGTMLSKKEELKGKCEVIGTLQNPVHAKNLTETLENIDTQNNLIIAIDACLGESENIGNIQVTNGMLSPGKAMGKDLPSVGDISIVGIVNRSDDFVAFTILQSTRLGIVYDMAEKLEVAINEVINKIHTESKKSNKIIQILQRRIKNVV